MADDLPIPVRLAAKNSAERRAMREGGDPNASGAPPPGEIEDCVGSNTDLPEKFYKEQRVEVEYKGKWYVGTYERSRYRRSPYGVQCDSDKKGTITWAKKEGLRVIPLQENSTCFVEKDGEWYEGQVQRVNDGAKTYDVLCKDAGKRFRQWPSERVRSVKPKVSRWDDDNSWSSSWKREPVRKPLTKLEDVPGWPAVYKKIVANGGPPAFPVKIIVAQEDRWGDLVKTKLPPSKARPVQVIDPQTDVGLQVGALWSRVDRRVYGAQVTGITQDGKISLTYNDGDKKNVNPLWITYKEFAHDWKGEPIDGKKLMASAEKGKTMVLFRERGYPKDKWCAAPFHSLDQPKKMDKFSVNRAANDIVTLWRGDITELGVDAIQNAANSSLWAGGGICGAIHDAAGPKLQDACEAFPEISDGEDDDEDEVAEEDTGGGWGGWGGWGSDKKFKRKSRCPTGQTRTTKGFKLHAKHVLHTVGPTSHDEDALEKAYISALEESKKYKFESIALCCVSTGIYGFPSEAACPLALRTVREWLEKNDGSHSLKKIIFCVFTEKDTTLYNIYMPIIFPCA